MSRLHWPYQLSRLWTPCPAFARISRTGQVVVSGPDELPFYDRASDKLVMRRQWTATQLGGGQLGNFAFSITGNRIAVVTSGYSVALVDVAAGKVLRKLETPARDRDVLGIVNHLIVMIR